MNDLQYTPDLHVGVDEDRLEDNDFVNVEVYGPEELAVSLGTPIFRDETLGQSICDSTSTSNHNEEDIHQSEALSEYSPALAKRRNSNQVEFAGSMPPKMRSISRTDLWNPRVTKRTQRRTSSTRGASSTNSAANTQKRIFACVFSRYGCNAAFGSKNEWKRHVGGQHLQLGFYRCDSGMCNPDARLSSSQSHLSTAKFYNDFNRKDLFTQHHRRMHTPWSLSSNEPSAQVRQDFENSLKDVRKRCWHETRTPPQRSTCGFCKRVFEGPNGWDERMEHVGKHFEDAANFHEEEDEHLRDWAVREGIVRNYGARGFWLVGMEHSSRPSIKTKIPTSPSMSAPYLSPSPSLSQSSDLTIEAGKEPVIPESSSITLEPRASENSGAGTPVAPPKVNGESITSSFSALVSAVVLIQRLNRTRPSKLDEAASLPVNAVPAAASRPSLGDTVETKCGGGFDMELWLSQSQKSSSSSLETDCVNSFEDDSREDSSGDENRNPTIGCRSTSVGLSSENMLSMLRPLFATLPEEISPPLTRDLTLLFDSWAVGGSLERPSHPYSSLSSPPPRSRANGSAGSSTENTSSAGSGKKRPLRNGSESPRVGDDDQNGDEIRKRLRLSSQRQQDIALRWACPFYQRSPHHYCVETEYGDYRKCAKSPGFSGVHRVKSHIYKCHASIYCDRCYSVCKNEDDLTAHRRDPSPCTVQDPRPMQGLTKEQKKLLKPRDRNKSEEARWNTIYKICFPNDEFIPSPYYISYSRETAELRRDVFDIVEEETRSLNVTVWDRIHERLQHAFDNAQMRSSLGTTGLPTPSSGEISSQQSREAGPSPRSPLASRPAAVTSISHQTIPAVTAEPGHMGPTQDAPFGEMQEYDADDHLLFDFMIGYPAIVEGGDLYHV